MTLYNLMFYIFLFKPVDVVEGIPLRASYFDGGIRNVRVVCDWLLARATAYALPIIPAWDLTLWK